jgi:eukaryotic-like serine/threonine-protein kinase
MTSTISHSPTSGDHGAPPQGDPGLLAIYAGLMEGMGLRWTTRYRKLSLLGTGGQGAVYLGERQGSDQFALPVALKFFSPAPYREACDYQEDMGRVARVAARVAVIQHDNVLHIHDFTEQDGIRVMEMEWLDGYDLRTLLTRRILEISKARLTPEHWTNVSQVIITPGPVRPRLKPGVAIQVLRDCLSGLAALHDAGIVHGDIKPSNVMLKRTGNVKIIDIGSAIDLRKPSARRLWSPAYAAPEVVRGDQSTPLSDLASLGYVLIEMLAGLSPFEGLTSHADLLTAKSALEGRLPELLPQEVSCNELLLNLCRRLVAPDPANRFQSAQAADLGRKGAAAFHRQLVKVDLASEYENDIHVWLERLGQATPER